MNFAKRILNTFFVFAVAGCSTVYQPAQRGAALGEGGSGQSEIEELPVPEIPDYKALTESVDTSAKVCVYRTLWFAESIEKALSEAGYEIVPVQQEAHTLSVASPDFIVEPLMFNHTTEMRRTAAWLYTRLVVQVRTPFEAAFGETGVGLFDAPRLFQVYARQQYPAGTSFGEAEYKANTARAIANLMCITEFRHSLSKSRQLVSALKPLSDFIVVSHGQENVRIEEDKGIPPQFQHLKPSFVLPPKLQPLRQPGKGGLVGRWTTEYNMESWVSVNGKLNCNKFSSRKTYTLRGDGSVTLDDIFSNGMHSVFDGSWSYDGHTLTLKMLGKDGKMHILSLMVVWYDDFHIELKFCDIDDYRKALIIGGATNVSAAYDENGCLKTYMEIKGGVSTFMIQGPEVYVKE